MFKVVIGFNHVHIYGATIAFVVLFLFFFSVQISSFERTKLLHKCKASLVMLSVLFFFSPN